MLKLKINNDGHLEALRKSGWKTQFCIYSDNAACGDNCPLFCEPEYGLNEEKTERVVTLEICQKTFVVDPGSFSDHRVNQD